MTTNNHPITPPPWLVKQWANHSAVKQWANHSASVHRENGTYEQHELAIATQAANWGANQELEACLAEVGFFGSQVLADKIRNTRRPKPPSLKEQALARTDAILNDSNRALLVEVRETLELNRRALEQLDG